MQESAAHSGDHAPGARPSNGRIGSWLKYFSRWSSRRHKRPARRAQLGSAVRPLALYLCYMYCGRHIRRSFRLPLRCRVVGHHRLGPLGKTLLHLCSQRAPEPRSADHWHRDRLREAAVMRADVHVLVHGETRIDPWLLGSSRLLAHPSRERLHERGAHGAQDERRSNMSESSARRHRPYEASMSVRACPACVRAREPCAPLELSSRGVLASLLCLTAAATGPQSMPPTPSPVAPPARRRRHRRRLRHSSLVCRSEPETGSAPLARSKPRHGRKRRGDVRSVQATIARPAHVLYASCAVCPGPAHVHRAIDDRPEPQGLELQAHACVRALRGATRHSSQYESSSVRAGGVAGYSRRHRPNADPRVFEMRCSCLELLSADALLEL